MTWMAELCRVRGADDVSPEQVVAALRGYDTFYRPTATRDESGDLLVSFFVSGKTGEAASEQAESALRLATEPRSVTIKFEWGGPVAPEPDRSRPESFPAIPTVEWLRRRARGDFFQPGETGTWFDVNAQIDLITPSDIADELLSELRLNMRAMRRFDRPKLVLRPDRQLD
jgi:hypothetical protein